MSKINKLVEDEVNKVISIHKKDTGKDLKLQGKQILRMMTKDRIYRQALDDLLDRVDELEKKINLSKPNENQQKDS